jgi:hypothetical protein
LIRNLSALIERAPQDALIDQCIEQLYENDLLIEGIHPNPAGMISRIQAFMEAAAQSAAS